MIIGFTRRTDLALSALRALASAKGRMSRTALAREIGTTPSFLPQVMAPLLQGGWVTSGRGPGGGYQLDHSAADLDVLQVIEATEGPAEDGRCVLRDGPCPGEESCPIHGVWIEARRVLMEGFGALLAVHYQGDQS
jgi:Rrf2 family protein